MIAASPRYPALDLMRGFSALTILVFHVIAMSGWDDFPTNGPLVWFRISFLRVDLFFVLSGFVITLAALREQQAGGAARGRFLAKRIARLAPAYFVAAIAWLWLNDFAVLRQGDAWTQVFTHLTFTYALFPGTISSINGVTWTLGVEMQLYALMALAMPLLTRWRMLPTLLVVLLVALAYRLAMQAWTLDAAGTGAVDTALLWYRMVQAPGMLDVFGAGVALALLASRRPLRPLTRVRWLIGIGVILIWSSVWISLLWTHVAGYWQSYFWASLFRTVVALTVLGWLWLMLVMPPRWAECLPAWLRFPGKISYGLFLWHVPVTQWLLAQTDWREWSLLAASILATGVVATLSWYGIESPTMAWARRRFRRRPDDSAAAPRAA
jgi:peptidoglycan/LPS O-acetylase OafA/YrhL